MALIYDYKNNCYDLYKAILMSSFIKLCNRRCIKTVLILSSLHFDIIKGLFFDSLITWEIQLSDCLKSDLQITIKGISNQGQGAIPFTWIVFRCIC